MAKPLASDFHDPSFLADGLPHESLLIPRADKRVMDIEVGGMTKGYKATIICLHGTTQEERKRAISPVWGKIAERHGIRIIAPCRPGYRRSSPWTESVRFGAAARKKGFPVGRAYLFDLGYLCLKLGIKDFGLMGASGGAPYAIAAAAHFQTIVNSLVHPSESPDNIPKLTAVALYSGNFPRYLWQRIADTEDVQGTAYDIVREMYTKAHDIDSVLHSRRTTIETDSAWIKNLIQSKIIAPGGYAEAQMQFSFAPCETAWGFPLADAAQFTAADGNGIRYFYGNNDRVTPALLGLHMALEAGGRFIYKTTTRPDGGFQDHTFDVPSQCMVLKDMLEAMGIQPNVAAEQLGGSHTCSKSSILMRAVIDRTTTAELVPQNVIEEYPKLFPMTVSAGIIHSGQRQPLLEKDRHLSARILLVMMRIMQNSAARGLDPERELNITETCHYVLVNIAELKKSEESST